jgi:hypothetical protein
LTEWICKKCPKNRNEDAGPFDSKWDDFTRYRTFHANCPRWQQYKHEKTIGELADEYLEENWDRMIASVKAWCLGEDKVCRLEDKWRLLSKA